MGFNHEEHEDHEDHEGYYGFESQGAQRLLWFKSMIILATLADLGVLAVTFYRSTPSSDNYALRF